MTYTALVIDDNAFNLETLGVLLKKEGVYCIDIINPNEITVELDRTEAVDVVFLDLEFPGHNGFNIIQELHADPRLQGVPIVAYTVHISELQEAKDAGFHSFLGKPLNVAAFPEQLHRILNGESVWDVGQ